MSLDSIFTFNQRLHNYFKKRKKNGKVRENRRKKDTASHQRFKKYFPNNVEPNEPKVDPKPDVDIDKDKVNTVLALLEKILNIILGWFTKEDK